MDNIQKLKKLKELLDQGAITQEEFDRRKTELLNIKANVDTTSSNKVNESNNSDSISDVNQVENKKPLIITIVSIIAVIVIGLSIILIVNAPTLFCSHKWVAATCTQAKHCTKCGKTEGDLLPHTWVKATCEKKKYCSKCGLEEGSLAKHKWKGNSCHKECTVCGKTKGKGHTTYWGTCSRCNKYIDEVSKSDFVNSLLHLSSYDPDSSSFNWFPSTTTLYNVLDDISDCKTEISSLYEEGKEMKKEYPHTFTKIVKNLKKAKNALKGAYSAIDSSIVGSLNTKSNVYKYYGGVRKALKKAIEYEKAAKAIYVDMQNRLKLKKE